MNCKKKLHNCTIFFFCTRVYHQQKPTRQRTHTLPPVLFFARPTPASLCMACAAAPPVPQCAVLCAAQFFQIMLKLRGSTMMRLNHEFCGPSALSPDFRNWIEMTRNMQQEGLGLVLLPRPASLVRCSRASLRGGPTGRVRCVCVCVEGGGMT